MTIRRINVMKIRDITISLAATLVLSNLLYADSPKKSEDDLISKAKSVGLKPIPSSKEERIKLVDNPNNKITKAKIDLGLKLYFDPRLSKSNLISCNTCHNLATGGVDGVSAAVGHKWTSNPHHLNSPTVYNAVFAKRQFWDGREPDLEAQAKGPLQAPPEMAISKEMAVKRISSMPEYKKMFKEAFGEDGVSFDKIAKAIAAFERTLVTVSRYDDYLNGDEKALTTAEKEGLRIFIDKGCASCHNDIALGGSMQPFPVVKPYKYANIGDFKGDKDGKVKVPTLRNILRTAPYFHNGAVWDIKEAVKIMGETQLGVKLSEKEVNSIVDFFGALNGRLPVVVYPVLPSVTNATPKPDLN